MYQYILNMFYSTIEEFDRLANENRFIEFGNLREATKSCFEFCVKNSLLSDEDAINFAVNYYNMNSKMINNLKQKIS